MTERREFSAKVKLAAFERANKHCERCAALLIAGKFRYNHRIPDALGGEPTLENCECLCLACDGIQTYKTDIPAIAKSKRIRRRNAGVKKPRTITGWRRFNGEKVYATRER
jgi:5-methylcytosine-specific restriction protein A